MTSQNRPPASSGTLATLQQISGSRRKYNAWVADETMEDYALRYTPLSFRKWSEWRVANTAYGSLSFLALEAIGATIAVNYGFTNAMWAILVVSLIIFLTGLPVAYYAARHGLDMDLLTRGAGFGYLGSTITSLVYATFTFIFFALEAAIMAMALQMAVDWPLPICYVLSSLIILPLAVRGITFISRLQAWTQPLWLFLLFLPFVWIAISQPQLFRDFTGLSGLRSGSCNFEPLMFGAATAVIFSLIVQIGEQVDFLRFLPPPVPGNRRRWWAAVLTAGPGWVVIGMFKMAGGAFLAFAAMQFETPPQRALEPTQMFLAGFREVLGLPGLAIGVTVVFVVISQIKINVTNAYAGSLAWSNFFARTTRSHPGRVVWLVFNIIISTLLMVLGVFDALEKVLGIYSHIATAWVGVLVADLVINKPLGLSPPGIEFRRAYLYDFNFVGLGAMLLAVFVGSLAYAGLFGELAEAFSPFVTLGLALLLSPLLAWFTQGRYYLARPPETRWHPGEVVHCAVCGNPFEMEDMAHCPAYDAPVCSLCCSLESRCHDRCKMDSTAEDQMRALLKAILPEKWTFHVNFRLGLYLSVLLSLCAIIGLSFVMVYVQDGPRMPYNLLYGPFIKVYALLVLLAAVFAWWVVLTTDSRRMAQDESERQTQRLLQEIEAHRCTDAALQTAKEQAETASAVKTRYVAGMSHELRTPLNSILGYTQILLRNPGIEDGLRETIATIQRSGQHMHALIDDSLELARIEAGRLQLYSTVVPLKELLEDVGRMIRAQAENKGLEFSIETIGEIPTWVRTDAKRLRQILTNLLSNSVRFTQSGSVRLRLDFHSHVARIDVMDTGIGIAPRDQERIFLPFERGSAGRHLPKTGTGLGLTITSLLVNMMGGELSLDSALGQGSTFTLRLYLPEAASGAPRASSLEETLPHVTGYEGRRRTLLVVDDQPVQRQLLAALLMPLGFVVHEAASGSECLEAVQYQRPDLVMLDIAMDDLNGWQTAALLREFLPASALPIVFVSANLFDFQPERLEALDCQGFIPKPIIESQLLKVLGQSLRLSWISDLPVAREAPEVSGQALANVSSLPDEVREELLRLSLRGQAVALRQFLAQAHAEYPEHAAVFTALQAFARHFDFQALVQRLRYDETNHDDPER
jgi:signal transduction histidine kinase/CheY-like chemotaxis protein